MLASPRLESPSGLPVVGHLFGFLKDRLAFLEKCARLGDVVPLRIGGPTLLLNHPTDIAHVLVTNDDNYIKTTRLTSERGRRRFGRGLLTSTGEEHWHRRRMMQPVFHRRVASVFADVVASSTSQVLRGWTQGTEIEICADMGRLARRVITQVLFGARCDDAGGTIDAAIRARQRFIDTVFHSLAPYPEHLPTAQNREYRRAMRSYDRFIYDAIAARRVATEPSPDLLSMLMQLRCDDRPTMSDAELRDEVVMLSVTGHETVADSLAWSCYLLAGRPDVACRLRAEARQVLCGRPPDADAVPRLRYAAMVHSEAMRLYPPTWLILRVALQDDALPSGATVPAGTKLYLSPYLVHRDARFFPDPERFDPERFAEDVPRERPRLAYFPFGAGPHLCIGEPLARLEGAVVLACIAERFRLTLNPGQRIEPEPGLTLHPRHGVRLRVEAQ